MIHYHSHNYQQIKLQTIKKRRVPKGSEATRPCSYFKAQYKMDNISGQGSQEKLNNPFYDSDNVSIDLQELQNYLVQSELMQEKERLQLNQLSMSELAGKTSLALQTHSNSKPHCVYTQIPIKNWKTYTNFHSMLSAYEEVIKQKQKKMSKSNIQLLKLEAHRLDDQEVQPSRFGYQKIRQPATQIQLHPRVNSQPLPSKRKARSLSSMEKTNYHDVGKLRKKPWVSGESNFGTGEKLELSVQGWSTNTTKIGFREVSKTRQVTTSKTKVAQRTYMAGLCEKLSKTPFGRSLGRKRKKQFQRRRNGINECIEGTKIQQLIRILDS